jgi:hypothetical protein
MSEQWTFEKLLRISEDVEKMKKVEQKARKIAKKVADSQPNEWQKQRQENP